MFSCVCVARVGLAALVSPARIVDPPGLAPYPTHWGGARHSIGDLRDFGSRYSTSLLSESKRMENEDEQEP